MFTSSITLTKEEKRLIGDIMCDGKSFKGRSLWHSSSLWKNKISLREKFLGDVCEITPNQERKYY